MSTSFTLRDWRRLPEGFPAQLVAGRLVKEPAPTYGHQRLVARIHVALVALVGPDRALQSPVDVVLDDRNVFQPDVVVLRRLPPDDVCDVGIPLLAVEVLSPGTRRLDRGMKASRLLEAGVAEVWLVDPQARTIEVRTPAGTRLGQGEASVASAALAGFALVPSRLFSPAV